MIVNYKYLQLKQGQASIRLIGHLAHMQTLPYKITFGPITGGFIKRVVSVYF